jgi:formylmethanofuran dehydrogenase subunit B
LRMSKVVEPEEGLLSDEAVLEAIIERVRALKGEVG